MLREALPRTDWDRRPSADCWSAAECLEHVNLTSEALLPLLQSGLQQARDEGRGATSRYRRDLMGWLIWATIAPAHGWKTKTIPAFVPSGTTPLDTLIADFERLQAEVIACVREADGLPIDRIKLVSPFDARVKYNLYAVLTLVPRHQHRHLLQAERAAADVFAPLSSALAV